MNIEKMSDTGSCQFSGPSTSGIESTPGCSSFQEAQPSTSDDVSEGRLRSTSPYSICASARNQIPLEMVIEMEEYYNHIKKSSNGKGKEMTMERYFYLKYRQDLKRDEERREERKRKALQEKLYREKKLKLMKLKISVLRELVKAVTKKRRALF